jgi:hypothetical protein
VPSYRQTLNDKGRRSTDILSPPNNNNNKINYDDRRNSTAIERDRNSRNSHDERRDLLADYDFKDVDRDRERDRESSITPGHDLPGNKRRRTSTCDTPLQNPTGLDRSITDSLVSQINYYKDTYVVCKCVCLRRAQREK